LIHLLGAALRCALCEPPPSFFFLPSLHGHHQCSRSPLFPNMFLLKAQSATAKFRWVFPPMSLVFLFFEWTVNLWPFPVSPRVECPKRLFPFQPFTTFLNEEGLECSTPLVPNDTRRYKPIIMYCWPRFLRSWL